MRWRLRRQRATAGAADAVTVRAHDVSPPRGGLIHISMAPQRQMHCNIAPVAWLLCSWTASVGKRNASICCGCLDRSVGGGRSSHGAVVCLRGFLRRENPYLCLYYVLLGCNKGCTKSQFFVVLRVGWLEEGGMGSLGLLRAPSGASTLQLNSRSGAGSFLIRGKVHRVQIEAA